MHRSRQIAALALILLATSGCGMFRNIFGGDDRQLAAARTEFVEASQSYTTDAVTYSAARATMRAARRAGLVTADKWLEFRISENAVAAATVAVDADLTAWGKTGKKPDAYDGHLKVLRDAQAQVIIIAKEFE